MKKLCTFFLVCIFSSSFSWGMEFQCTSSTYMDCGGGNCRDVSGQVNLTVDLEERMVLRETKKNSRDFMAVKNAWVRDNKNSLYVLYEDKNSHGFVSKEDTFASKEKHVSFRLFTAPTFGRNENEERPSSELGGLQTARRGAPRNAGARGIFAPGCLASGGGQNPVPAKSFPVTAEESGMSTVSAQLSS